MDGKNYVLAMYDIRAKQKFIFNSNHLKEIVGGSLIIRDCFKNYLYNEDANYKIYHEDDTFSCANFEKHINEEGYSGEVVYEGGGNFLVLFKDEDTFKKATYEFTKNVFREVGTLRILATCVEITSFEDFKADRNRLYAKHRLNEQSETNIMPWGTIPIVQVDPKTSYPLTNKVMLPGGKEKVSKESAAKYNAYNKMAEMVESKNIIGTKILDELVSKKGEDSLLAIIYSDGNNMGDKVRKCLEKVGNSYEACINELRRYSKTIQKEFIDDRIKTIDAFLEEKYKDSKNKCRRLVLGSGDEINMICNAHDAFNLAKIYLEDLPEDYSACAGIAIFHSHAPYSEAYRIAEECCESGKIRMKKVSENTPMEACYMDFHYCQSGIGISLDNIREQEGQEEISRPWLVKAEDAYLQKESAASLVDVEKMCAFFKALGRSNIKGLMPAAKSGVLDLEMEIRRIEAHMKSEDRRKYKSELEAIDEMKKEDIEAFRRLVYDTVLVYDLWFGKEE